MKKTVDYTEEVNKLLEKTKVVDVEVNDQMKTNFIAYAMAVNVSRAIPDVRDGLKPVHRRIIYGMGEAGYTHDKAYKKCARIVGDIMGKYHPHGDSSIYDALVRLAQDFSINCPLIDGHGNFGSVDGDGAAAMRYTEARLSKISSELLRDIDRETVDFVPNYDGLEKEPKVLPSRFPNLLVNGSDGIAVGMATNIPPHNLKEVIDAVLALADNPEIDIDELLNIIPAPDYPTRGIIMGGSAIKTAYKTGKGGIIVRARTEIEENESTGRARIIVTELPYQVNKAKLIMDVAELVKEKKVDGIANIRDESDRDGMRIVIDIKKDFNAQVVLNFLYKHTELQVSDGIILLALVDGTPKILNLKQILEEYLKYQKEIITRRTRYDLKKAEERAHILKGLVVALQNIDEVIHTIKKSTDKQEALNNLMSKFNLTEIQAGAILEMKLQRLTNMEVSKIEEELSELEKAIIDYNDILAKPQRVLDIVKAELVEIRDKYGVDRKSEISLDYSDINIADLIEKEDVVVSRSHLGYVKRLPVDEYRSQNRGGKGMVGMKTKEEDFVEDILVTNTHVPLLCFTNKGKVYEMMAYEIPEASKQAKGRAMVNLLQLDDGEKVNAIIPMEQREDGYLLMTTKNGLIKKTHISEFDKIRKVGKIAIKLLEDDQLISVQLVKEGDEVVVATHEGKCIRFSQKDVRAMGRDTQGVKCMDLNDGDYLVDMLIAREGTKLLTISELGYGKRSSIDDYRLQLRAGKGIKAGVFNDKTGKLVGLKQVADDNDIMLISDNGTIIRIHADSVSLYGRDTLGVRVMRTQENEKIVSVAISPREDESEESSEGEEVADNVETTETIEQGE
ncbi:MAG: DNA gyrase subunit A [Clostridiales bacterium]|nr:DNA gyrase subunit A [Candidatus Apopatousia equi]